MLGETEPLDAAPLEPQTGGAAAIPRRGRSRYSILTRRDKTVMALMVGVPTFLCVTLIWLPTIASIGLSFTNWRGITPLTDQNLVGLKNYVTLFTTYPFFWPAVIHNVLWLVVFVFIATPIGIFLAVLLDREMRGTRIYQSVFFVPVVLSLAIVGFMYTVASSRSSESALQPVPAEIAFSPELQFTATPRVTHSVFGVGLSPDDPGTVTEPCRTVTLLTSPAGPAGPAAPAGPAGPAGP